jgi:hypothetical protein
MDVIQAIKERHSIHWESKIRDKPFSKGVQKENRGVYQILQILKLSIDYPLKKGLN